MAKQKTTHICLECLGEFDAKDVHIALIPSGDFFSVYCTDCIKALKITDSTPYKNSRKKKTDSIVVEKKKVSRTKKAASKSV